MSVARGEPWPLVVAWAVVVGVGVDLDHFLWARYNTGEWAALRRVARAPRLLLVDQRAIFDPHDLGRLQRLFSHVLVAGLLVVGLAPVWWAYAATAGISLYVHVVADLLADVRDVQPGEADSADG